MNPLNITIHLNDRNDFYYPNAHEEMRIKLETVLSICNKVEIQINTIDSGIESTYNFGEESTRIIKYLLTILCLSDVSFGNTVIPEWGDDQPNISITSSYDTLCMLVICQKSETTDLFEETFNSLFEENKKLISRFRKYRNDRNNNKSIFTQN